MITKLEDMLRPVQNSGVFRELVTVDQSADLRIVSDGQSGFDMNMTALSRFHIVYRD